MAWKFELSEEFRAFLPSAEDGEWMPCPRCGAKETAMVDNKQVAKGLLITTILCGIGGLMLPLLWIVAILAGLGAIAGPVFAAKGRQWSCKRCKLEWNWARVEYVKSKM